MKKRSYWIYSLALLSLSGPWIAACDHGTTEPAPEANQPPVGEGPLPWEMLETGGIFVTGVSAYFRDPDDEILDYNARSLNPGVVVARTEESLLTLQAVGQGMAEVTVSAIDPGNLSASLTMIVSVAPETPDG